MLRHSDQFCTFDASWKAALLSYQRQGSTYGEFVYMGAIPGLAEVARQKRDHGERVLLRDPRGGYAECMIGPSEDFERITFLEGLDAFALEKPATPLLVPAIETLLDEKAASHESLDSVTAAIGRCLWWGDEPIDGGHRWYYMLTPPALLVADADANGALLAYRAHAPAEGVELLRERLAQSGA